VNATSRALRLSSQCHYGFFGDTAQFCDACPDGAVCEGALNARSLSGWYNVTYNGIAGCTPRHRQSYTNGSVCWQPLPCQPPEACLGNNTCSSAYMDAEPLLRCSACSPGHYRPAGDCVKCPKNVWVLIIGFIVVAVLCAVLGYFLNRKSVNIAFLSIGVDYFQVRGHGLCQCALAYFLVIVLLFVCLRAGVVHVFKHESAVASWLEGMRSHAWKHWSA
jgi:hypothetical protein